MYAQMYWCEFFLKPWTCTFMHWWSVCVLHCSQSLGHPWLFSSLLEEVWSCMCSGLRKKRRKVNFSCHEKEVVKLFIKPCLGLVVRKHVWLCVFEKCSLWRWVKVICVILAFQEVMDEDRKLFYCSLQSSWVLNSLNVVLKSNVTLKGFSCTF